MAVAVRVVAEKKRKKTTGVVHSAKILCSFLPTRMSLSFVPNWIMMRSPFPSLGVTCFERRPTVPPLAGLNHCSESFPPLLIRREWNLSIFLYLGDREQSRIVLQIVCAWFFASPGTTWKGMGPRNCSGAVKVAGEQWTASLRSRNMRKIEKERHHSSGSSN